MIILIESRTQWYSVCTVALLSFTYKASAMDSRLESIRQSLYSVRKHLHQHLSPASERRNTTPRSGRILSPKSHRRRYHHHPRVRRKSTPLSQSRSHSRSSPSTTPSRYLRSPASISITTPSKSFTPPARVATPPRVDRFQFQDSIDDCSNDDDDDDDDEDNKYYYDQDVHNYNHNHNNTTNDAAVKYLAMDGVNVNVTTTSTTPKNYRTVVLPHPPPPPTPTPTSTPTPTPTPVASVELQEDIPLPTSPTVNAINVIASSSAALSLPVPLPLSVPLPRPSSTNPNPHNITSPSSHQTTPTGGGGPALSPDRSDERFREERASLNERIHQLTNVNQLLVDQKNTTLDKLERMRKKMRVQQGDHRREVDALSDTLRNELRVDLQRELVSELKVTMSNELRIELAEELRQTVEEEMQQEQAGLTRELSQLQREVKSWKKRDRTLVQQSQHAEKLKRQQILELNKEYQQLQASIAGNTRRWAATRLQCFFREHRVRKCMFRSLGDLRRKLGVTVLSSKRMQRTIEEKDATLQSAARKREGAERKLRNELILLKQTSADNLARTRRNVMQEMKLKYTKQRQEELQREASAMSIQRSLKANVRRKRAKGDRNIMLLEMAARKQDWEASTSTLRSKNTRLEREIGRLMTLSSSKTSRHNRHEHRDRLMQTQMQMQTQTQMQMQKITEEHAREIIVLREEYELKIARRIMQTKKDSEGNMTQKTMKTQIERVVERERQNSTTLLEMAVAKHEQELIAVQQQQKEVVALLEVELLRLLSTKSTAGTGGVITLQSSCSTQTEHHRSSVLPRTSTTKPKAKRTKPAFAERLKVSLRSSLAKVAARDGRIRQMSFEHDALTAQNVTLKQNEVVRNLMEKEYLQQIVTLQEGAELSKRKQEKIDVVPNMHTKNGKPKLTDVERTVEEAVLMSLALKQINGRQ